MKNTVLSCLLLAAMLSACNPSKKCVENIQPDCMCTRQYDPVCGCNNKTYGNACMAACAGITTYKKGECPKDAVLQLEGVVWQLSTFAVSPEPQQVPENISITLKLEAGNVTGRGGCNNIGGTYVKKGKNLSISQLLSTKMFCEDAMKWESMYLQQLEKSQSYSINGETLEINCGDSGNLIFRLNWKKPNWE